mmetsp:Transcript_18218/g.39314  ORF Transcript_18218/g.39314 Transcript_18218/m.39314 type:complete len:201 (-) Transcript_18218:171-773(-)
MVPRQSATAEAAFDRHSRCHKAASRSRIAIASADRPAATAEAILCSSFESQSSGRVLATTGTVACPEADCWFAATTRRSALSAAMDLFTCSSAALATASESLATLASSTVAETGAVDIAIAVGAWNCCWNCCWGCAGDSSCSRSSDSDCAPPPSAAAAAAAGGQAEEEGLLVSTSSCGSLVCCASSWGGAGVGAWDCGSC